MTLAHLTKTTWRKPTENRNHQNQSFQKKVKMKSFSKNFCFFSVLQSGIGTETIPFSPNLVFWKVAVSVVSSVGWKQTFYWRFLTFCDGYGQSDGQWTSTGTWTVTNHKTCLCNVLKLTAQGHNNDGQKDLVLRGGKRAKNRDFRVLGRLFSSSQRI